MIIKRLIVHNFGVYAGTNIFEFSGKKPIVLIGGLNGRGKTTFLEAILLSLYGANSFAYKESTYKTYGQYLKSYVNKNDGSLLTFTELTFLMGEEGSDEYVVRREWDGNFQRIKESILVKKNGTEDEFLTENWSMFIEGILPSALSNFFFFDGEKIAELAVENTSAQLKESIRSMLGINVLERTKKDLYRTIRRNEKLISSQADVESVSALRERKETAEAALVKIDGQIALLDQSLETLKQNLERLMEDYHKKGGDIAGQQKNLLEKKGMLNASLEQNSEQLIAAAAEELPLALVRDLIDTIYAKGTEVREAKILEQTVGRINNMFLDYQRHSAVQQETYEFIQYINDQIADKSVPSVYNVTEHTLLITNELLKTRLDEDIQKAKELLDQRQSLQEKKDEIESYLNLDINEEELRSIYQKIKAAEQKIITEEVKKNTLLAQRTTINGEVIKTTSEFNRAVEQMLDEMETTDDVERVLKYSQMAIRVLDEYIIRLQADKIGILAETITDCYQKLANKKHLILNIEMNTETLDLKYIDYSGVEVPRSSLSAGEKQLMVIAILWALAKCSKKKLPVIIDTPLSRLDSIHRKALIESYFPYASDQTIILSTDSEIDAQDYELMKDNVGDEFILMYDDDSKSTTIHRGYFSEAKP